LDEKGLEIPFEISVTATGYLPYYARTKVFEELTAKEKKAMVKRAVRALKPVVKEYNSGSLYVKRKFGKKINFSFSVSRDVVCKAVKTGNKIVHAASYIPERVEEEVEWVCTDPLLKETA
jgi:hypothetical protein